MATVSQCEDRCTQGHQDRDANNARRGAESKGAETPGLEVDRNRHMVQHGPNNAHGDWNSEDRARGNTYSLSSSGDKSSQVFRACDARKQPLYGPVKASCE